MTARPPARTALALAAVALSCAAESARAADAEKPLPVDRNAILPGDVTYVVEGRVRIPKGLTITIQKDTKLLGRKDAVLEVEGELEIHGVGVAHVPVRDVTIELPEKSGGVHLDMVDMLGKSAVVTAKDKPADAHVFIDNVEFQDSAKVDVEMCADSVHLQRVRSDNLIHVKAVDGPSGNKVKFVAINCCHPRGPGVSGVFLGGISVENVSDVTVRTCNLAGEKASFTDCGAVTFDANLVACKTVEFTQKAPGRFGRTTVTKCDFNGAQIVAYVPYVDGKGETLTLERCWFEGETVSGTIRDQFVKDRSRDPKCGVTVEFRKVEEKPLALAGVPKK